MITEITMRLLLAKKPETLFQEKVQAFLKSLPLTEYSKIQQVALCGDADLIIVCNGFPIYMELKKSGKERAKNLQRFKLLKNERAGALSMLIHPDNWGVCMSYLKELSRSSVNPFTPEMPECLRLKLEHSETQFFTTQ